MQRACPKRFLSNRSSGRLGYALAKAARTEGARVTLVSGPVALRPPKDVSMIPVVSAREMYRATLAHARRADIIICAAAVADWRPLGIAGRKIKKEKRSVLELAKNPDILATIGKRKRKGQYIVGFALESERLLENAWKKLRHKHCDCIIANPVPAISAARHQATLLFRTGQAIKLPPLPKPILARRILQLLKHTLLSHHVDKSLTT
ncbi:MAG: phosphopantothenoylcysteine decarboxylase [Deltaproteobacteria bacterium]|nr:phosphopantothenoylcysteine decarboxylase [Deltaproteobacteria bacterium]